jgi:hypothetical protein
LIFKGGSLQSSPGKVEEHLESFNIYATREEAIKLVTHYENLCKTLNEAIEVHSLGSSWIQELARCFDLLILDNKLIINDIKLAEKIKYLQ